MKTFLILFISLFQLGITRVNAQKKLAKHTSIAPFQGTQHFCSNIKPIKYDVTIKGSSVSIIRTYKENVKKIKGTFVKGKLFTNDRDEKENKAYAGSYYKISKTFLAVNNLEGGDYIEFGVCK